MVEGDTEEETVAVENPVVGSGEGDNVNWVETDSVGGGVGEVGAVNEVVVIAVELACGLVGLGEHEAETPPEFVRLRIEVKVATPVVGAGVKVKAVEGEKRSVALGSPVVGPEGLKEVVRVLVCADDGEGVGIPVVGAAVMVRVGMFEGDEM